MSAKSAPVEWTWPSDEWATLASAARPEQTLHLIACTSPNPDAFQAALEAAARLRELADARTTDEDGLLLEIDGGARAAIEHHARERIDDDALDSQIERADEGSHERRLPVGGFPITIAAASSSAAPTNRVAAATIADDAGDNIDEGYQPSSRTRYASQGPGARHFADADHRQAGAPVKEQAPTRFGPLILAAGAGVVATIVWQSYGDGARQLIANRIIPQLAWSSLASAMGRASAAPVVPADRLGAGAAHATGLDAASAEAVAADTQARAGNPPIAPRSPELQQLETISHDLAAMRQRIEELAANQAEMARERRPKEPRGGDGPGE
jgi:hypothetical protein